MRQFFINAVGMAAGMAVTLLIFTQINKPPPVPPTLADTIKLVARANFATSEIQFHEVTGLAMVCMAAVHTNAETRSMVANMQCVKK